MRKHVDNVGQVLAGAAWLFFGISVVFANAIIVPHDYTISQYTMAIAIALGLVWLIINQVWGEKQ
jgi:hypothetical protein